LAHFNPARAIANAGSSSALLISWKDGGRPGQSALQYEIHGSAYGGGNGSDGASATAAHLSNLHITPIEIIETEFPCRITEFALIPDSGGRGEFRGGLAMRRRYELLQDASVVRRFDKAVHPPSGLAGGEPGRPSSLTLRAGTPGEELVRTSGRFELEAGDCLIIESPGGGGYGDRVRRAPDAIARDRAEGYTSD
jgi:N-methylhydantoinase B